MSIYGLTAVLRIWIRIQIPRIHVFMGLLDPDPDPLVRGMDPDLEITTIEASLLRNYAYRDIVISKF